MSSQLHAAESMVGAVLGSYRIVERLSVGGMGTVYRAEHELLGKPAAVKLLRPELSRNDELVQRFFNEAKAATEIRHPAIIDVYHFGYTDEGEAYFVMEFLEGEPLARRLQRVGRFHEGIAGFIARSIASALKAAHGKGIIHRDLKPDNIFLVPDPDGPTGDRVKVLDFGIAKLAEADGRGSGPRHTQTGVLMGTPLYMAPEQARAASEIDHRADLYALGCILYELLVGKPPFIAEGAGEIVALQLFAQPVEPSVLVPGISPEMERIVMRLLHKEPDRRFQTAAELMDALAEVSTIVSGKFSGGYVAPSGRHFANTDPPSLSGLGGAIIMDERPSQQATRSRMPYIAGGVTLGIIVALVVFVALRNRGGDDDTDAVKPPPAAAAQPAEQPKPAPPPPAKPPEKAPPKATEPPKAAHADIPQPPPKPVVVHSGRHVETKQPKQPTGPVTSSGPVVKPDTGPTTGPITDPNQHTDKGSPTETDIGDGPRKPKVEP